MTRSPAPAVSPGPPGVGAPGWLAVGSSAAPAARVPGAAAVTGDDPRLLIVA